MGFIGLQEGLTLQHIHKGFEKTSIWPLNPSAMASKIHLSKSFRKVQEPKEVEVVEIFWDKLHQSCKTKLATTLLILKVLVLVPSDIKNNKSKGNHYQISPRSMGN
jgi:predicted CoA-binding protein